MKKIFIRSIFSFSVLFISLILGCSNSITEPNSSSDINGHKKLPLSKPSDLTINLELNLTGPNTAEGTFDMSGAANDDGTVYEEFRITPGKSGTAHGHKTLYTENGHFEISFQVRLTPTSPTTTIAEGRFNITNGSDSYEGFHGNGDTYLEIDFAAGTLSGTYSGHANFDNRN